MSSMSKSSASETRTTSANNFLLRTGRINDTAAARLRQQLRDFAQLRMRAARFGSRATIGPIR
jgi:hypothetical protein